MLTTSLPTLEGRFATFINNLSNSLIPACETTVSELLANLKLMKEKNLELDVNIQRSVLFQNKIDTTKISLSHASNYKTKNGKEIYTGERDRIQFALNKLLAEKAELDQLILELQTLLEELQLACNTAISNIKLLAGAIELFSGTSADGSFIPDIEGLEFWKSTIYVKDGVYYQIPIRVTDKGVITPLEPNYVICIDSNKIKEIIYNHYGDNVEGGEEYYNKIISFLNERLTNSTDATLYDFRKESTKKMSDNEKQLVSEIMDQILNDTYVCNGATTIQDYAAVSATVTVSNALVKFGYGRNYTCETEGFNKVITDNNGDKLAGNFDCNTLVKWSYYQGFKKLNPDSDIKFTEFTIDLVMADTTPLKEVNSENFDSFDIGVGSVLTRRNKAGVLHTGLVVGFGTDENGNETVVTAQATNQCHGCVLIEYSKDDLYKG